MVDPATIATRLEGLAGVRVLVVGDVMLDQYVSGSVERVSPEAPIPVLRIEHQQSALGGAGNVARNVAALGGRASLLASVGDDEAGRRVGALLAAEPNIEPALIEVAGRPTTVKTRYLAAGQQLLRSDLDAPGELPEASRQALAEAATRILADSDIVVLSDYAKGTLGAAFLGDLIAAAGAAGKEVVADPKSADFSRYAGVTLLTPNRAELELAGGRAITDDASAEAAARAVANQHGLAAVLLTRGAQGMTLVDLRQDGEGVVHLPVQVREVFDVSGAGDTVVATMALARGAGCRLGEAAELANLTAGIVVGKVGTAAVYPGEVMAAAEGAWGAGQRPEAKVLELAPALEVVERWRRQGERLVFTNGCFDLPHPGHVALLERARAAGDRLVVGLNGDASVTRLKGAGRPIQGEAARATVLASFAAVDLVVIFAADTPRQLIEALRPDLLVKGADYSLDQVVGADIVAGYGGQVMLVELEPGHSTSQTIARLAAEGED
ncbi:MAG TPA: D-glycero-beta-D-manno-heptose 1-phosphate adenylyltransferase [Alphaproteobacteria bacterium]|jgi:D-beta-D-heptose 7-phosphate kinase/D-beta-D-heptose 1-phosphate adenosyltransferase|nr:D-glycero-beta-D-manno-heptose 1-phosphate adenylyltransferase [Alphaproteobacteria bacterium]MDP6270708.1 D-glycero-beta-D-manno-heptose 1-phosphate adenylyltransferase [Alphaproteobacteria bacterium]MDP7426784.1 D-glycero-beta-D-manno-heptose 1-phosphate adenylyltransferase [Alphaproteobacteria bacterium]HJM48650.1 D-glycero-beta-D-manno-heptose 1-phosphate adenylyltransferase [Alphaproteobacteria bacterium]